jgi:hypothetical protein
MSSGNSIERKFALPFGFTATFHWQPGILNVHWAPAPPRIRKARSQRKFFEAYQAARRSFLEEVSATMSGKILIVDTNLKSVVGTEVISVPTRH